MNEPDDDTMIYVSPKLAAIQMMLIGMGINTVDMLPYQLRKAEKRVKECLLPDCDKMTIHNGGYCCAEHKRLSKGKDGHKCRYNANVQHGHNSTICKG